MKKCDNMTMRYFVAMCGGCTIVIGFLSLMDYLFDMTMFSRWSRMGVPMAINTALSFIISGAGLLAISLSETFWRKK